MIRVGKQPLVSPQLDHDLLYSRNLQRGLDILAHYSLEFLEAECPLLDLIGRQLLAGVSCLYVVQVVVALDMGAGGS